MASYNPNNLSQDELSCPICFEEFCNQSSSEHAPKLLLCLHTFCLGCIRNLVRSNKTIQCSICRTEHSDVSPQELFDNYVIMEYVRKQQEESDARLAQQHSELLMSDQSDRPGYQQRQEQLLRDADLARKFQQIYDMEGNDAAPPPSGSVISAPTVSVMQRPEVLCTAQESFSRPVLVASCSMPCRPPLAPSFGFSRSASTSASSSSPSTSSVVTISSNTFSDSSSDSRCSSRDSSSSRLEEEFVDTVETLEMGSAGIAGAAAVSADDGAEEEEGDVADAIDTSNSSCTGSALSPAYTDNSGFSHHNENNDSEHSVDNYNEDDEDDQGSDMEDNSSHQEEDSNDNDSLHLGETFSEHIEDDAEADDMDADGLHDSDDHGDQEDELFNNFSVLEAIVPSPEGPVEAHDSYDPFSTNDTCISISSTESYPVTSKDCASSGQFHPIRRNFPLSVHSDISDSDTFDVADHTLSSDHIDEDDKNNDTITLSDSEDSASNATNKTYINRSRSTDVTKTGKEDRLNI